LQAKGRDLDKVRVLPPITPSVSPADEIYSIQCKKELVTDDLKDTLRNFGNLLDNYLYNKEYTKYCLRPVNVTWYQTRAGSCQDPLPDFERRKLHRRSDYTDPSRQYFRHWSAERCTRYYGSPACRSSADTPGPKSQLQRQGQQSVWQKNVVLTRDPPRDPSFLNLNDDHREL